MLIAFAINPYEPCQDLRQINSLTLVKRINRRNWLGFRTNTTVPYISMNYEVSSYLPQTFMDAFNLIIKLADENMRKGLTNACNINVK